MSDDEIRAHLDWINEHGDMQHWTTVMQSVIYVLNYLSDITDNHTYTDIMYRDEIRNRIAKALGLPDDNS